ncbi:MAG: hypothetical protein NZT61_02780 [Deltaproteobacteria bacterium]|nr:hypothetical protein [Deltaproteobacteria bacterium]MCX7952701.1 hypothetical protein [Deltaproteobacteria bacterium]
MSPKAIYLGLFIVLSAPFFVDMPIEIPRNFSAEGFFQELEKTVKPKSVVMVGLDYGPGTSAENYPQSLVVTEHLFRLGAKVIFFTFSPQAKAYLENVPKVVQEKLKREGINVEYGRDFIILGFRPAPAMFLQGVMKTDDLVKFFERDMFGTPLKDLALSKDLTNHSSIAVWVQFTGLVGMVQNYIQFLETGSKTVFFHGCTSITVPEAHIYTDSGQIRGLIEGLPGSVAYEALLSERFPVREKNKNTVIQFSSLSFGQAFIFLLIVMGNIIRRRKIE